MEPDEFSNVRMYGDRCDFEVRQKQGYTEYAFVRGPWIDSLYSNEVRIPGGFVYYKPNGDVAVDASIKFVGLDGDTARGAGEGEFTKEQWGRFQKIWKLGTGKRASLSELLSGWDSDTKHAHLPYRRPFSAKDRGEPEKQDPQQDTFFSRLKNALSRQ